ncbi:MAG: pyridoxamine 5'-phosphate oxidase family protein [Halopseudomonas sp.]
MSNAEETLRQSIVELLHASSSLTLATLTAPADEGGEHQSWATELFFASDESLSLYFISSPNSRHSQDILHCPQVSATVSGDVSDWFAIKGLQLSGRAKVVTESQRSAALALYLDKFPSLRTLYQQPANDDEERIRQRLDNSCFYCIEPQWIRLIDNSRQFASKQELRLS